MLRRSKYVNVERAVYMLVPFFAATYGVFLTYCPVLYNLVRQLLNVLNTILTYKIYFSHTSPYYQVGNQMMSVI